MTTDRLRWPAAALISTSANQRTPSFRRVASAWEFPIRPRLGALTMMAGLLAGLLAGPVMSLEGQVSQGQGVAQPVLSADFDGQPLGEIGNGGARQGQPAYAFRASGLSAEVVARQGSNRALQLVKTDSSGVMTALNWRFLDELSFDSGTVEITLDVTPRSYEHYSLDVRNAQFSGAHYVQVVFDSDGNVTVPLAPGSTPGSYLLHETSTVVIICDFVAESCSVEIDGHIITPGKLFSSSITEPSIGGFATVFPGQASNGASFEIDNLKVTASQAPSIPVAMVFDQQPVDAMVDTAMEPAVRVAVQNVFGNPALLTTPVSLQLLEGTAGAVLSGGQSVAQGGQASFAALSVDLPGDDYRLQASLDDYPDVAAVESDLFDIHAPGSHELEFLYTPERALIGQTIPAPVKVRVLNAAGELVTDPVAVTLSIHTGPGGGALIGTLVEESTQGEAVFADLAFTKAGSYRLLADTAGIIAPALSPSVAVFGDRIFHSRMEHVASPD